jgi:hypothetical protein
MSADSRADVKRLVDGAVYRTINRVVAATVGTPAGVEVLALLSVAVTVWKKTHLPIEALHKTIDALAKSAGEAIDN